jgi:hypothetical protein
VAEQSRQHHAHGDGTQKVRKENKQNSHVFSRKLKFYLRERRARREGNSISKGFANQNIVIPLFFSRSPFAAQEFGFFLRSLRPLR